MGKPRSEIQVHNQSIKARQVLLEDVLADVKKYVSNEVVTSALKNQGALASLSYKFDLAGQHYAIDSTSLNTLKKKSDELLGHHGFAGLERLRESPNKPSVMRESPQHLIRAAHEPDELFRL